MRFIDILSRRVVTWLQLRRAAAMLTRFGEGDAHAC